VQGSTGKKKHREDAGGKSLLSTNSMGDHFKNHRAGRWQSMNKLSPPRSGVFHPLSPWFLKKNP